ncbi:TPA: hypothetical protein IAA68_04430 [Candidatus Galligastranaerophilus faecipullorum]|nr:hypothetical protein [Candidatus Galligastranaerophilus faecipullorum]
MKNLLSKTVLVLLCLFLFPASNLAIEEDGEAVPDVKKGEVLKDKIITLDETIDGDTTTDVEFDDDDNLDFRLFTEKTFAKKKSVQFDNNFINEISGELRFQGITSFEEKRGNLNTTFPFDINAVAESKFGSKKYRFFTEYAFTRNTDDIGNAFFGKFSNLYIERNFSKNHKMRVGVSRSPIGLEGSMSSFALPFAQRAQISREFGDAISTGISFIGNKGALEYNMGGYTSTRFTQGFKDGAEFIGRIGVKPFYKQEGSYFKNLKLYAGADVGHRGENYGVYSAALTYEYKKFLMNFEYAYADGSNGDYFDPRKRQGFFATAGYNITPKLQLLARYDYFDRNLDESKNINHEYSVGINYFVFKQRLKFALNYVFSNDEKTNTNKNAIYFLTQFFI